MSPVRKVSPLDWFRGDAANSAAATAEMTREQLSELAEQFRVAQQAAAAVNAAKVASKTVAANGTATGASPLLSFPNSIQGASIPTPSQIAMPNLPGNVASAAASVNRIAQQGVAPQGVAQQVAAAAERTANAMPQVQLQSTRLPFGQPVANIQNVANASSMRTIQQTAGQALAGRQQIAQAASVAQAAMNRAVPQVALQNALPQNSLSAGQNLISRVPSISKNPAIPSATSANANSLKATAAQVAALQQQSLSRSGGSVPVAYPATAYPAAPPQAAVARAAAAGTMAAYPVMHAQAPFSPSQTTLRR